MILLFDSTIGDVGKVDIIIFQERRQMRLRVRKFVPAHAVSKQGCLNINPSHSPNDSPLHVTGSRLPLAGTVVNSHPKSQKCPFRTPSRFRAV